jgi:hypothetical protein
MATTGIINTKSLRLYVGGTPVTITCQNDAKISIKTNLRSTTCKDSGQWEEDLPAQSSWEISGSGWASYDGAFSVSELCALILAQTVSPVVFGTGVTGDDKMAGSVNWTSVEVDSSGTNENAVVSYSAKGTGALALTVYA